MGRAVFLAAIGALTLSLTPLPKEVGAAGLEMKQVAKVTGPTALTSHPSSPDRVLVTERAGRVRVIERGVLKRRPLLDIRRRVNSKWIEQGLLGIAMAPDHGKSGRFYVMFTRIDGDLLVEEWRTLTRNRNLADPASRRQVIRIPRVADKGNHNGGVLRFLGRHLYITVGDGNDPGDYLNQAQDPFSLRGKILRIVPRPDRSLGRPYRIPSDNPFADGTGRPEVFATGLRNPHALFFNRRTDGSMAATVYDVGQLRFEEINHLGFRSLKGANFGWKVREGLEPYDCEEKCPNGTSEGSEVEFVQPVHVYEHAPDRCAVIGGPVVRDRTLTGLTGRLVFGDFCSASFSKALPSTGSLDPVVPVSLEPQLSGFPGINAINEDARGRVYVIRNRGQILMLVRGR